MRESDVGRAIAILRRATAVGGPALGTVVLEIEAAPGRNVPALRCDLQRAYVEQFAAMLNVPPERMPADARAVARFRFTDLNRRLAARLRPPTAFDAHTTAHLQELRAWIGKALEPGMDVTR